MQPIPRSSLASVLFGAASLAASFAVPSAHAAGFTLSSPDIQAGSPIPKSFEYNGFGCSGENKSPALHWSGAPSGTKSFAVTVHDPDAPTGSGWWHWVVIDIPASVTELAGNAGAAGNANLPKGAVQGRNDYGTHDWGGVCPPPGDKPHRYVFTVYALGVARLDIPADATAALTGFMIHANTLAQASFTAPYGRPK
ncbi:MAG: YbhB/YbcL family Raf kinase inhibitor-like protein [Burkholderiales bacterium]|nr:YbhB/YbcL family Raf kinase inhibitor-like protein [Burkholderiales bacterium]